MMTAYEFHPMAELFPLLEGEELREMAENIHHNGLLHPIVMHQGKVLDGRNRLRACELAEVEPIFTEWSGDGDPSEWVVITNLHRRHLNTSQRALIALELKKRYVLQALERMHGGRPSGSDPPTDEGSPPAMDDGAALPGTPAATTEPEGKGETEASIKGKASQHAARTTGVSARTIERAEQLVARAAPELVGAVRAGAAPVSAAVVVANLPAEEQRAAVRENKVLERARALRESPKPAKVVNPPAPVVTDDSPPLILREFKAAYKKGPQHSQRQPPHEVARLEQIAVTATLVERAWKWIAVEWDVDRREDMHFAVEEAQRMTPLIVEFGERLADVIARCRGVIEEDESSEETPAAET